MPLSTSDKIVNAVLFQLCWLCAIFWHWHYALMFLLCLAVHSAITYLTPRLVTKLLGLTVLGIFIDSAMMHGGIYQFDSQALASESGIVPLWLCILWFGFMLTLCSSLAWLMQRPKAFVIACAIAGPISYASGRKFDALNFDDTALFLIAFEWIVVATIAVMALKQEDLNISLRMKSNYAKDSNYA